jgi:hypothetical protein
MSMMWLIFMILNAYYGNLELRNLALMMIWVKEFINYSSQVQFLMMMVIREELLYFAVSLYHRDYYRVVTRTFTDALKSNCKSPRIVKKGQSFFTRF